MQLAYYQYRNIDMNNKEEWPIQPPTTENWCKMLANDDQYCRRFKDEDWELFYEAIMAGTVKSGHDLPNHHPYWRERVKEDFRKQLKRLEESYQKILENENLLPILFNKDTTLKNVKEKIDKLKEKCNGPDRIKNLRI